MKAPLHYFGGKSRAVDLVWHAFGAECRNYVEPFFGSGAMLLGALIYWHLDGISGTGRLAAGTPEIRNSIRAKRFGFRRIAIKRRGCFDHFVDLSKMVFLFVGRKYEIELFFRKLSQCLLTIRLQLLNS